MNALIVYWSGTGNTEDIANKIKEEVGCEAVSVSNITASEAANYDTLILGCPAMGSEELEDSEFLPFNEELLPLLTNQRIFLFGSYGWGDGEWLRNWKDQIESNGHQVLATVSAMGDSSCLDESEFDEFISKIKA